MDKLPNVTSLGERPQINPPPSGVVSYKPNSGKETLPGEGMSHLGLDVAKVGDILAREQFRSDTLRAEDAFNQLRQQQLDLTAGDDGFVNKKGGDAVNQPIIKDYGDKFNDSAKKIEDSLSSDQQRGMFRRRADVARLQFTQDMVNHVHKEQDVYSKEVYKGGVTTETQNAALRRNDPSGIGLSIERIKGLIQQQADRNGWAPDLTNAETFTRVSDVHTGVTEQLVADKNMPGARSYFNANRESIGVKQQLHLESLFKADAAELRSTLADNMKDVAAMADRGLSPPAGFVTPQRIDEAYAEKPEQAAQLKRQLGLLNNYATGVASLNTKDNQSLIDFVTKGSAPTTSRPEEFAEQAHMQAQLQAKAADIIKARLSTPMEYAAEQGYGVKPLDISNVQGLSQELANRETVAKSMSDRFGSPLQLMTRAEAGGLANALDQMPSTQKLEYLRTLRSAVKDDASYGSLMQQIRPDSPVTAQAGALMMKRNIGFMTPVVEPGQQPRNLSPQVTVQGHWFGPDETMNPEEVAARIIEGESILNPTKGDKATDGKPKFAMPHEDEIRTRWNRYVGDAYRGFPKTENESYQAFRAFYAAEASRRGKYTGQLDNDIADRAAIAVSGGVSTFNGKNVVLPWGMDRDVFYTRVTSGLADITKANGITVTSKDVNLSNVGPDPVTGADMYSVWSGSGPLRGKNGEPVVLRIK